MPARLWVSWAFFCMVGLFPLVVGPQAQRPENASGQKCGHTDCRELSQVLTAAVTTATHKFEAKRSRLDSHDVYFEGWFSRFIAFVKRMLKAEQEQKQKKPGTITGTESQSDSGDSVSVYNVSQMEHLLSSTRKTLIKNLKKNPDFDPLITYIQKNFPTTPPTIQIRGVSYVKEETGDSYLAAADSFLSDFEDDGPGPVSLYFTSAPERGAYVILKSSRNKVGDTVTDGSISGLPRGEYSYEVTKEGYKPGADSLDVAREKRDHVKCYLEPPNSTQNTKCVFE